ncbi:MAG: hypothetical protein E4H46_03975 [Desulfobacterales bacterium]|nr:MAG: hypothetical protein E4H46_03975 [Desulfobacterales bacterium]
MGQKTDKARQVKGAIPLHQKLLAMGLLKKDDRRGLGVLGNKKKKESGKESGEPAWQVVPPFFC